MAMQYSFDIVKAITPLQYEICKLPMVLLVFQLGIESRVFSEIAQIWFDMKFEYFLYTSDMAVTYPLPPAKDHVQH